MSDEFPSIAELQRVNLETNSATNPYASFAVRDAAPVLLEIAAAALALREQCVVAARAAENAASDGTDAAYAAVDDENYKLASARRVYDTALDKVRP